MKGMLPMTSGSDVRGLLFISPGEDLDNERYDLFW